MARHCSAVRLFVPVPPPGPADDESGAVSERRFDFRAEVSGDLRIDPEPNHSGGLFDLATEFNRAVETYARGRFQ